MHNFHHDHYKTSNNLVPDRITGVNCNILVCGRGRSITVKKIMFLEEQDDNEISIKGVVKECWFVRVS